MRVRWTRFCWELDKLPDNGSLLDPPYCIRQAKRSEHRKVSDLLLSNLALDADWTDLLQEFRKPFEHQIEDVFDCKDLPCIVVALGQSIVGASTLDPDPGAQNHLVSGPSVMNEYRNRGLGSALLYCSLLRLREAGIARAYGITRAGVPTARFLYTKYNSTNEPSGIEPLTVSP